MPTHHEWFATWKDRAIECRYAGDEEMSNYYEYLAEQNRLAVIRETAEAYIARNG